MGDEARDAMEAAWDASEEDTLEEPLEVEHAEGPDAHQPAEPERETEEPTGLGPDDGLPSPDDGEGVHGDDDVHKEPEAAAESDERAPVGLSAAAREEWKNTPKAMRDEVAKRERDFSVGMQKNAEMAKRAAGMDQQLRPYQQYFQMNGGAGKSIKTALDAAAMLQMGTPGQRAQTVANLIQQFGVDVNELDNLLVGEAPSQASQQHDHVQQAVQQAVAPYQQQMAQISQAQQRQQYEIQEAASGEVTNFANNPANEFYHDVKMDMADLMDMAQNRGIQLTLQDAYDRACRMNPEINRIQTTRIGSQAVTQKRRAASSITGNPGGVTDTAAPDSMLGALNDAWDNAGRN